MGLASTLKTLFSSDSGRSKPPSKTAGTSRNQNPNIYTPKESSVERSPLVVANSIDANAFLLYNFKK